MSNRGNFQGTPRVKNIFDNNNLVLKAPCPTPSGKGQFSRLTFQVSKGNPRIVIWTNDPADKENQSGKIEVRFTPLNFHNVIELIRAAADSKEKTAYTYECGGFIGKPARVEVLHNLTVGRDEEGYVYIVVRDVMNKTRPVIMFRFIKPEFGNLVRHNGEEIHPSIMSTIHAKAFANMLEGLGDHLMTTTWEEPQSRNNNNRQGGGGYGGGGNQGGYGGGGGNQGGYNQTSTVDIDEDIPY